MNKFLHTCIEKIIKSFMYWFYPLITSIIFSLYLNTFDYVIWIFIISFVFMLILGFFHLVSNSYRNFFTFCIKTILFFSLIAISLTFCFILFSFIYFYFPILFEYKIAMVVVNSIVSIFLIYYFCRFYSSVKEYFNFINIEFKKIRDFFYKHNLNI